MACLPLGELTLRCGRGKVTLRQLLNWSLTDQLRNDWVGGALKPQTLFCVGEFNGA